MKYLHSVIATNQINRKNMVFANECLEDGARQINEGKGQPTLHSHDWTRLIGWTSKAWIESEKEVVKLVVETEIPETDEEKNEINQRYSQYLLSIYEKSISPFHAEKEKFNFSELTCDMSCVYLDRKDITCNTYPCLQKKIDDDGLLLLEKPLFIRDGFVKYKDHILVPHIGFRDSFALMNTLNKDFFSKLSSFSRDNPEAKVKVRVERDLLGITKSLTSHVQLDYWWGPKYNNDPFATALGVCVHGATKYDIMFGRFKQTEFWWYQKDRRTFEIEEVLEEPIYLEVNGTKKIGMRFIHSIFDSETKRPSHLDGALRLYDFDLFQERKKKNIKEFGKSAERLKLWRIDGDFSIQDWFDLIHTFFRNNYMVGEYFGFSPDDMDDKAEE